VQELNSRGSHLLFRDKAHQLHLFNLATQQRSSLLSFCQYVQWVPGSDVVVAQSRSNLYVWYSINNPDRCGQHQSSQVSVLKQRLSHTIWSSPPVQGFETASVTHSRLAAALQAVCRL
jgi:hypothetical protein